MNVSQEVSSAIDGVSFGLFTPEDVRKLSVKRITTATTLDTLLNPVPGGLWDPAFGKILGNPCSTCRLDERGCPGHCGHIELPAKVYHCVFIDQAFRLLRAQCYSCRRLRMSKTDVQLYWCKLQLIRRGLLKEADEVEDAGERRKKIKLGTETPAAAEVESEDSEEEVDVAGGIIARRHAFVTKCIKLARSTGRGGYYAQTDETLLSARKRVIAEFKADMTKATGCKNCGAVSPSYRKNQATAIYRKPLGTKGRAKNVQNNIISAPNPLLATNKKEKALQRKVLRAEKARAAQEMDEGVADLESSPDEDEEDEQGALEASAEEETSEEDEEEAASRSTAGGASLVQTESSTRPGRRKKKGDEEEKSQVLVTANEVHALLTELFEREMEILRLIYQPLPDGPKPSADMFFIQNLLVPPSKFRKESKTARQGVAEPPEHTIYKNIISTGEDIWQITRELQGAATEGRARLRNFDDLQRALIRLQEAVNGLFDSAKSGVQGAAALRIADGVKQKLEKKEGMFRMNIMGKRVNFAARSVISPDPNIETNEIGIPPVFAKKLTFPEPVFAENFERMKEALIYGPDGGPNGEPGANAIEDEFGRVTTLRGTTQEQRLAKANTLLSLSSVNVTGVRNKKVHRHLRDGDYVIMNRQPTLHKPSMMCHKARILRGEKTLRMHYANCNTYNADFDGDEMNMHFPQNEAARIEAQEIANTDNQYLSATAGEPLRGLIQDHISMSTWLTCVDMFFTRAEYQELLYSCIRPESDHTDGSQILMVEPAVLKPKERWTGKQVITTLLKNVKPAMFTPITMESASQIPGSRWENEEEGRVRIIDGELLTGVLDKKQIGPKSNGVIHSVYEVWGATAAGQMLSILGRLLTRMLNMRAFSCGIEDLLLTDAGNAARREKMKRTKTLGLSVATTYVQMEESKPSADSEELLERLEDVFRDDEKQSNLDAVTNSASGSMTSEIWSSCLPDGLVKPFPRNQMQTMTASGAKGSNVNAGQISGNLGQQTLEGRRVPVMISGKTLPSFKPFETDVRAGGYISDRFLTGVRPQEFYFSLMAGREGLIDTAVKTSRSGYLQRCLVKGLEGLRVDYDTTVRDSDGTIVQTVYGEDGLDITKQKKITDFDFITKNYNSYYHALQVKNFTKALDQEAIDYNESVMDSNIKSSKPGSSQVPKDPALSLYPPISKGGSTSEKFYLAARKYMRDNKDKIVKEKKKHRNNDKERGVISRNVFKQLLEMFYRRAVVEPGEAVGVVAAQSIGEPSTQMTLNTFHLAGFAAKNVTLGIPRLRELIMTASRTLKKPTMTLHPIEELTDADCISFAKGISRLSLAEIIESTSVDESIGKGLHPDSRIYNVQLNFYPGSEYTAEYAITRRDVGDKLELTFLRILKKLIKSDIYKRSNETSLKTVGKLDSRPELGKSAGRVEAQAHVEEADNEGGDSDEDEAGDGDATDAKRKANLDEGMTYEDPDESEAEIEAQGEREAADEVADSDDETRDIDEGYGGSEGMSDEERIVRKRSKDRAGRIRELYPEVTSFKFDERTGDSCRLVMEFPSDSPRVLLLGLVNQAARKTLIQEVEGLGSAYFTPADGKNARFITTEGCNLLAVRAFTDRVNPHTLLTNDVWAMRTHYGVDAARDLLIRELGAVFSGHSIDVDHRHLTLVADYMTRDGGYLPFSRNGMKEKSSPFAKMSFETTLGFLGGAILDAETEDLSSPSARITVGKLGKMGSGMCDILMPVAPRAEEAVS